MNVDISNFQEVFFDEVAENLATIESLLLGIDIGRAIDEDLNAIFRAAHSIKGGAGMFGLTGIAAFTHVMETLLDRLRRHELELTVSHVDAFLEASDVIRAMVGACRGEGEIDVRQVEASRIVLTAMAEAPSGPGPDLTAIMASVVPARAAPSAPHPAAASIIQVEPTGVSAADFGFFDDAPATAGAPVPEAAIEPEAANRPVAGFGVDLPPADAAFGFFEEPPAVVTPAAHLPAVAVAPRRPAASATSSATGGDSASIRVGVGKVDQLINLVGELVINQAMLAETASRFEPLLHERLSNGLAQLERNTRNLQESVMSMRMMPVSAVFSRFPRVVRDIAQRLGKDIELRMIGETTEIDRGVIEKITDPLTHLVRNSLDHGIETPDMRIAAGKPPRGSLTLRASHRGANIVIEVMDDGAGLRRDKILAKARERGFEVSESMPDSEVWQLIFEPGFSTADQITDVSGRGVGMDVVRRNIAELGGRIDLDSVPGHGTHITIRLPLTLAILDGLSVALGDDTYIIPLAYIVESMQPRAGETGTVGGGNHVIQVRNEYLPVLPLDEVLGGTPRATCFEQGIFVILDADDTRIALFVDELVGESQVVIKSLEANYAKVTGVSGATILGDGRVALILDVPALVRRHAQTQQRSAA